MNAKFLIAAVSLLVAAGGALAAPNDSEASAELAFRNSAVSTKTRAQVIAETIAARKAGELDVNEAYQDPAYMAPRARNADVKAQLAAKAAKDQAAR